MLSALLLSLLIGIAGALVRDMLDTSVKTGDDIEEITESSLLVTLPFDPAVKRNPLSIEDHGGSLGEAFRVLRTNLQFSNLDAKRQMLVISSAVPEEGKTFVATNLAISMAKSGRSVLLIDADMRNPNVAELLGLENSVGLITVLLGRTTLEHAIQEHVSGVRFLGQAPSHPTQRKCSTPKPCVTSSARCGPNTTWSSSTHRRSFPLPTPRSWPRRWTACSCWLALARRARISCDKPSPGLTASAAASSERSSTARHATRLGGYGYGYGYGYGTSAEQPQRAKTKGHDRRADRPLSGSGRRVRR